MSWKTMSNGAKRFQCQREMAMANTVGDVTGVKNVPKFRQPFEYRFGYGGLRKAISICAFANASGINLSEHIGEEGPLGEAADFVTGQESCFVIGRSGRPVACLGGADGLGHVDQAAICEALGAHGVKWLTDAMSPVKDIMVNGVPLSDKEIVQDKAVNGTSAFVTERYGDGFVTDGSVRLAYAMGVEHQRGNCEVVGYNLARSSEHPQARMLETGVRVTPAHSVIRLVTDNVDEAFGPIQLKHNPTFYSDIVKPVKNSANFVVENTVDAMRIVGYTTRYGDLDFNGLAGDMHPECNDVERKELSARLEHGVCGGTEKSNLFFYSDYRRMYNTLGIHPSLLASDPDTTYHKVLLADSNGNVFADLDFDTGISSIGATNRDIMCLQHELGVGNHVRFTGSGDELVINTSGIPDDEMVSRFLSLGSEISERVNEDAWAYVQNHGVDDVVELNIETEREVVVSESEVSDDSFDYGNTEPVSDEHNAMYEALLEEHAWEEAESSGTTDHLYGDKERRSIELFMLARGVDYLAFSDIDTFDEFKSFMDGSSSGMSPDVVEDVASVLHLPCELLFEAEHSVDGVVYQGVNSSLVRLDVEADNFEGLALCDVLDSMEQDEHFTSWIPRELRQEEGQSLIVAEAVMDQSYYHEQLMQKATEYGLDDITLNMLGKAFEDDSYGHLVNILRDQEGLNLSGDFSGISAQNVMDVLRGTKNESDNLSWDDAALYLCASLAEHEHGDSEIADKVQDDYAKNPHSLRVKAEDSEALDALAEKLDGKLTSLPYKVLQFEDVVFCERDGKIYMDPMNSEVDVPHVAKRLSALLCERDMQYNEKYGFDDIVPLSLEERKQRMIAAQSDDGPENVALPWTGETSTGQKRNEFKSSAVKGHFSLVLYNKGKTDYGVLWIEEHERAGSDGSINKLDFSRVHVASLSGTKSLCAEFMEKYEEAYQRTVANRKALHEVNPNVFVPESREDFQFYTNVMVVDSQEKADALRELREQAESISSGHGLTAQDIGPMVIEDCNPIYSKEDNTMELDI